MAEFDDISEEERLLAAEFTRQLENGVLLEAAVHLEGTEHLRSAVPPADPFADLASPIALLSNHERFELSAEAQRRGRAEIEEWAKQANRTKSPSSSRWHQWFYWLAVPAAVVAALAFGLNREGAEKSGPATMTAALSLEQAESEPGFAKLSPRFHAGETPRALLHAQTAVLTQREPGIAKDKARDEFNRQMRAYRGQLIASLEVGGE